MNDDSRRRGLFILEIWIPFVLLGIGGVLSFGKLSADVEHKADLEDVAVIQVEVEHIKSSVKEIKDEQKVQRKILERIERKVSDGGD